MTPLPPRGTAISFDDAARDPQLPRPVDPRTVFRWSADGVQGVKLASWKLAGQRVTTRSALRDFLIASGLAYVRRSESKRLERTTQIEAEVPTSTLDRVKSVESVHDPKGNSIP